MATMYETGGYYPGGNKIKAVEVERTTETSVWIKGRRVARRCGYRNYYDTWQEAKDALVSKQEEAVASLRRALEVANSYLGNLKGMKEPQP